jgi:hypothetical protein
MRGARETLKEWMLSIEQREAGFPRLPAVGNAEDLINVRDGRSRLANRESPCCHRRVSWPL